MKQITKLIAVILGTLIFSISSVYAAEGVTPEDEDYITVIRSVAAGIPLGADKLPEGAVLEKPNENTIKGEYKGVHFEKSSLMLEQEPNFTSVTISPDNMDADTTAISAEVLAVLKELYGPWYMDYYTEDGKHVYVWESNACNGYDGFYHLKGGTIHMTYIPEKYRSSTELKTEGTK